MEIKAVYNVITMFSDSDFIPKVRPCANYDKAMAVMKEEKNNALDTYFNGEEVEISDNEDVDEVFINNGTGDWCHIVVKHQTIEV